MYAKACIYFLDSDFDAQRSFDGKAAGCVTYEQNDVARTNGVPLASYAAGLDPDKQCTRRFSCQLSSSWWPTITKS